jgi:cation diffusion facilitator CzcD-associated flavoprotein CzcO
MAVLIPAEADTPNAQRVCVIGAGPCGLAALKNLLGAGLRNVVCYDESASIGGNWVFDESPRRTSVYASTHIISSKAMSGFDDFPMPHDYPDFPSHRQMRDYFEAYAARFGLAPYIRLRHRVEQAALQADGRWSVSVRGPGGVADEIFDHFVVCSGHHRAPFIPTYPGSFAGEMLHSCEFKRPEPFADKRVLVVGAGNSACDIAVDCSRVAARTCLSVRRGSYIVPKLVCGRPVDVGYARIREDWHVPRPLVQPLLRLLTGLLVGPWEKYGLPRPQGRPLEAHPTLNSAILMALRDGSVQARAGVDRLDGNTCISATAPPSFSTC